MAESRSRERATRWWGWGYLDKTYDLAGRGGFRPFLLGRLAPAGVEPGRGPSKGPFLAPKTRTDEEFWDKQLKPSAAVDFSRIELPAPRVAPGLLEALQDMVGGENLSVGKQSRLTHAMGKSYCDLVRFRRGQVDHPPDLVVYPQNEGQVRDVLLLAKRERYAVIPFGGGTSVVGGVEPVETPGLRGAISLDLGRMNQVLEVDDLSRIATVQAGIRGPALESALARRGYTLGHFPQSFELSTLGGWIATRSAGQQSTRYGKIEEMVVSLRTITPSGPIETRRVPASASGPSLKELLMGSEGTYGIITQASLAIHPQPALRDYRGLWFRSFPEGLAAIREMIQGGLRPATVRLSDPEETQTTLALRRLPTGLKALKERLGRWLLRLKGYSLSSGSLLILGFEGEEAAVEREMRAAVEVCTQHRGYSLGKGPGQAWYQERFETPYLRDLLLDWGLMVDTLETATTWDNLEALQARVRGAIERAIEEMGCHPLVISHVSHVYPQGASLYYTFLSERLPGQEIEQWRQIKEAATSSILEGGGALSHHHGVGLVHLPWMEREHGREGMKVLRALKGAVDPSGIMNPGKLII